MELSEALSEFGDETIDFLHIVRTNDAIDSSPLDLATWMPKVRPGGVIVLTQVPDDRDDSRSKVWRQLSEWYPSASIGLPGLLGIVQIPCDGRAPLVEFLQAESSGVSALFRALGERVEYRHVLSSEPLSSAGIRRYLSELIEQHADEIRRMEAERHALSEAHDRELASVSEKLLTQAYELSELQSEADYLLAKLASRAAAREREVAAYEGEIAELKAAKANELEQHVSETSLLHSELADREAHIQALSRTVSWRLTRPLRIVQSTRMKLRRRTS
jgi:hypothetical protein